MGGDERCDDHIWDDQDEVRRQVVEKDVLKNGINILGKKLHIEYGYGALQLLNTRFCSQRVRLSAHGTRIYVFLSRLFWIIQIK